MILKVQGARQSIRLIPVGDLGYYWTGMLVGTFN